LFGKRTSIFRFCFISFLLILFIQACDLKHQNQETTEPRYIVTSPELAEILAAVDGTDRIYGITSECDYPLQLAPKKVVGTFGKIDIEKVIALKPSLIFTSGLEQDKITADLRKIGLNPIQIYPKSVSGLLEAITTIGEVTGNVDRTRILRDSLSKIVTDAKKSISGLVKPKVYIEIYGSPIMSVSRESYIGELIELAGGKNIFSGLSREYSRIKPEEVVLKNPDVILLTYPGVRAEDILQRKGWGIINACRNSRIYSRKDLDPDLIIRATPRSLRSIYKLREIFYEK